LDRKSASARFPANSAAISDWNPSPVILMPNGLLLRQISQLQRSGYSSRSRFGETSISAISCRSHDEHLHDPFPPESLS
jgi:hypothetical protein